MTVILFCRRVCIPAHCSFSAHVTPRGHRDSTSDDTSTVANTPRCFKFFARRTMIFLPENQRLRNRFRIVEIIQHAVHRLMLQCVRILRRRNGSLSSGELPMPLIGNEKCSGTARRGRQAVGSGKWKSVPARAAARGLSIGADAGALDHASPMRRFGGDAVREVLRRAGRLLHAERVKALDDVGIPHDDR